MDGRVGPTGNLCYICRRWMEQPKRGRLRLTCSDACRQARRRALQGKNSRRYLRGKKEVEARRALPFGERSFNKKYPQPVLEVSFKRWVYECIACGKPYLVERILTHAKISAYCSDACEQKADYHWKKFADAVARSHLYRTRIDPRVWERLEYNKLSPLCRQCGKPFAPNTSLDGKRLRGRPRKYCSDACRKAGYEWRWRVKYQRARVHRFHECAECGTKFDRTDTMGRRKMRFCTVKCSQHFRDRAMGARRRARLKGVKAFRWGASGFRWATLNAPKNKARRVNCDSRG